MISLHSSGGHTKPINRSTFLITFFFLVFILNGLYYTRRFPFSLLDCDEQEARIISPQELLARPLTSDLTTVPQIFHQSWSSSELPAKFEKWSRSCRRAHPDWEWVLWTDEDNYELVLKHAPWFLETYSQLAARAPVYQADVVRNLYMHVFGGVYADLDMECLRPTETLISQYGQPGGQAFIGRMGTDPTSSQSLPNAWFASTPGHPFWLQPMSYVTENMNNPAISSAEALTGPGNLHQVVTGYAKHSAVGDTNDSNSPRRFAQHLTARSLSSPSPPSSSSTSSSSPPITTNPPSVIGGIEDADNSFSGSNPTLTILPFWEIYPYSWQRDGAMFRDWCWTVGKRFDEEVCKKLLGTEAWGSHAITYWSHSWGEGESGVSEKGLESVSR